MTATSQVFISYLAEPAMLIVIAVVFITGIVRGFSGFGSGMIIGPTTAALFGPQMALAMLSILDAIPTLPLAWSTRKQINWHEVLPIAIGYACLVPAGIWVLKSGDPTALRWFISISIFIAVAVLWSCLLYTSPSPRDKRQSRMPSSA